MELRDVVKAWDEADPGWIHPARSVSEEAYWESGRAQADQLATVLPAKGKVVDFGCGDGRVAIPLRELGYTVVAVDSSPTLLASVPAPKLVCDGMNLSDQLPEPAAAIYCLAVLIHHSWSDGERLVGEMAAALKPGGLLVLDWPVSEQPVERGSWIEVTTWSQAEQDRITAALGLGRIDGPWSVFRKT